MEEIIHFLLEHWLLTSALIILVVIIIFTETRGTVRGVKQISPQELTNLVNHESAVVLDVRSKEKFAAGHITGAQHVPFDTLVTSLSKLKKHKKKPVIVACNVGQSSLKAGATLRDNGFESVYSLKGGVQGWKQQGLPLTK